MVKLTQIGMDLKSYLKELEIDLMLQALIFSRGNRTVAAKILGLKRTTLVEALKRNGLENTVGRATRGKSKK